jgi:hypothetical protein
VSSVVALVLEWGYVVAPLFEMTKGIVVRGAVLRTALEEVWGDATARLKFCAT